MANLRRTEKVGLLPSGNAALETLGLTPDITHPDWPMPVGVGWVVDSVDDEGGIVRTEVTVLAEPVAVAAGIEARVVHDVVTANGALVADSLAWYAQDADGNVWKLGEQTAALAPGRVVTTDGSWEAGTDGARAGIVLPAIGTDQQARAG
ncbi:MAG: hypothetical protein ABWY29_05695 [Blastococcus sp.]